MGAKFILNADDPRSKSGRKLTPIPRVKYSPKGRNSKKIDRIWDEWMIENTLEEIKGDSYQEGLINAINLDNVSQSDRDMLGVILFGESSVTINYNKDENKTIKNVKARG